MTGSFILKHNIFFVCSSPRTVDNHSSFRCNLVTSQVLNWPRLLKHSTAGHNNPSANRYVSQKYHYSSFSHRLHKPCQSLPLRPSLFYLRTLSNIIFFLDLLCLSINYIEPQIKLHQNLKKEFEAKKCHYCHRFLL